MRDSTIRRFGFEIEKISVNGEIIDAVVALE